jgi:chorismate mutase
MNPALRTQLLHLDRALLSLLDERARLYSELEPSDPARAATVDELLRRHAGPFPPEAVREIFAAVEQACRRFSSEEPAP